MVFNCRSCGADLYLDDHVVSKSGKRIPLEEETGQPHNCPEREQSDYRSQPFECNKCGISLFVSSTHKSKNNKFIPLEYPQGHPHDCPKAE